MDTTQLLSRIRAFNPEITSLHVQETVFADGDHFLLYEAHVAGESIFGDTIEELMDNVRDSVRRAA